ncbi:hypothetical protein OG423_02390 [Micromonospora zamorensis]|nr:hypothetical protein OG423_02390 [Micromonospora zamorensis]
MTAGALWALLASPSVARLFGFIGTFLGVVVLHILWDTFSGSLVFVVLAIISIGWLFWELRRYRTFVEHPVGQLQPNWPSPYFMPLPACTIRPGEA